MRTIKLEKAWSYVSPQKTIDYPAGEHEVTNEVAAKAEADGAIPKEEGSGDSVKPAAPGKARAPREG